jgi:hypothetical protein
MGLQVGGHGKWDLGQGHGIMGRADVTFYGEKFGYSDKSWGAGADYTYHLDHNRHGFYVLGGLSVMDYHWSTLDSQSHTDTALGPDVGVGYDLDRHLGLQARYTFHNGSDSNTLSSLNLGVTYSF